MVQNRKRCREQQPCMPETLAQSIHCLVMHAQYTLPEIVTRLKRDFDIHITEYQLSKWSNAYQQDRAIAMPVRVQHAIQVMCDDPIVVDFMAGAVHHRIEPLANSAKAAERECLEVTSAVGRLAGVVAEVTEDGRIDDRERPRVLAAIRDVKQEMADIEGAVSKTA